jgi:uncharacterized protein
MRKGNWIQTHTGGKFYPLDPRPEEIDIQDIAHSLARICRFNGHGAAFYSVAQHSWIVSSQVGAADKLWGLLHDAAEAYIGDLVSPLKKLPEFSFYREIENNILKVIVEKFDLYPHEIPMDVQSADLIALRTEARDLGLFSPEWAISDVEPFSFSITPLNPCQSEILFLNCFHQLKRKDHP